MHDIDRGGDTTAARLAALAALRNAQADGASGAAGETDDAQSRSTHAGRGRPPCPPGEGFPANDPEPAPRLGQDVSAGVYAAVEAAVKRSRIEFVARLVEYGVKLDCDAIKTAGTDGLDASLDEAQFVAHRIAGVGKTLGFADLGDTARQTEAAIVAYKLERSAELRKTSVSRICKLAGLIEIICAENSDCPA